MWKEYDIVKDYLGFMKLCSHWVTKMLTERINNSILLPREIKCNIKPSCDRRLNAFSKKFIVDLHFEDG